MYIALGVVIYKYLNGGKSKYVEHDQVTRYSTVRLWLSNTW